MATQRPISRPEADVRVRLLLAAAFLTSAACSDVRVEDLKRPAYVWDAENGLCGRTVAVDGAGIIWREHGCESNPPFTVGGVATAAEVEALADGFLRLRAFDPIDSPVNSCSIRHLFQERPREQPPFTLGICAATGATSFDDPESLIEPFTSLARAFLALSE